MVRMTGSVRGENSLTAPSGELFSSVVRRSSGKRAKRMSGTESRARTTVEPPPRTEPRNDRPFSRNNPCPECFSAVASESPEHAHIEFSRYHELQSDTRPSAFDAEFAELEKFLLLFRQFPDVRDQ